MTLAQEGTDVDVDFSALTAHDLISKDLDELKSMVHDRRDASREKGTGRDGRVKAEPSRRGDSDKYEAGKGAHISPCACDVWPHALSLPRGRDE